MSKATSEHAKIQRWIDLIAVLLAHQSALKFTELAELVPAYNAKTVGLSTASIKRMFERDKDELHRAGIWIERKEIKRGDNNTYAYRLRKEDFYLPYLFVVGDVGGRKPPQRRALGNVGEQRFEPAEIAIVAAALARLGQLHDPLLADDARSAARALAFDLPGFDDRPSDVIVLGRDDGAKAQTFASLSSALRHRKAVAFTYQSPNDSQPAKRSVHPYGLFFVSAHWYLAAFDPARKAMRNFRLSRMSKVGVNKAKPGTPDYEIPPGFRLREHAHARRPWEFGDAAALEAQVRVVGTRGAAVAAADSGEAVSGQSDLRRFANIRQFDAFARWLLSFAGDLVPVSPPQLVDEYRKLVRATLQHYEARA